MAGSEAIGSDVPEPVVAEVSTSSVTEDSTNGTQRVSFDRKIRENPAYRMEPKAPVKVTLMSDGEIRVRKLADTPL
jgi:hypothetical protein